MRDIFVTLIILGSLPFILQRPFFGILVWCWLGFMNPHRLCWGFAKDLQFAQIVAITTLISIFISKEPKEIPWTRETKVLLLFIIWMFITTFFALNSAGAWGQWDKVWKIQLMIFVTLMIVRTPEQLKALVWITALSIGFYGIKGGIFTIMTGGQHMVLGPSTTFIGVRGGIALALNMTIPLMRYLQLNTQQVWVRRGLTAAMVLTVFAIIGTQSRGGFLGAIVVGLFLALKSRKRVLYLFAAIIVAISIAWKFAYNLASDHPIFGGGFECFRGWLFDRYAPNPDNVHDAHNIFFEVLGEQGFIGLFLYVLLLLFAWRTGSWTIRNAKNNPETKWMADLASMVQVSIAAYVTGGSFLGLAYFDYYYHLIAILVLTKVMLEKYLAEHAGEEEGSKQ